MPRFAKILFFILFTFLTAMFLFTTLGYHWLNRSLPVTQGSRGVEGLADSVEVFRDGYHLPYIITRNHEDLWFMQGYVTAQDRFFQMDYLRRLFQGRLSGLLGKGVRNTDLLMKDIGLERMVHSLTESLSPEHRTIYESYTRGVNAYLKDYRHRLPVEYRLLQNSTGVWRIEDCLLIYFGYTMLMEWQGGEAWVLQALIQKTDLSSVRSLFPADSVRAMRTRDKTRVMTWLKKLDEASKEGVMPRFISGGHVWTVPDSLSMSGKPLMAVGFSGPAGIPSFFYEIHLQSPEIKAAGFSLPGFPAILSGYNAALVWGSELLPRPSRTGAGMIFTPDELHASLSGTAQEPNDPGDRFFSIIQAGQADTGLRILSRNSVPVFRWICADTSGLIVSGPSDSHHPEYSRIRGWKDLRVIQLIRQNRPVSIMDCQNIQSDNLSTLAERLLPELLPFILTEKKWTSWANRLGKWDGHMRIGDAEAVVFETWIRKIAEYLFLDDLEPFLFEKFMSLPQLWQPALLQCILSPNHWVHEQPEMREATLKKMIGTGLEQALEDIQKEQGSQSEKWSWGRVHAITYRHPLLEHEAFSMSRSLGIQQPLMLGPYSMDGCYFSISGYHVFVQDSCAGGTIARMIVDLNALDNTLSIISTGQSGQMIDAHYQDQVPLFTRGYYHPNLFETEKIRRAGWARLQLYPEAVE